ncbi:MAG: hypothetical protein LH650_15330 [Chloroflexi bacterium]|nr:hypothetical protein [Chloroflexota bacterium]
MTPTDLPRVLAIMGSGETAPTMARVHRMLFGRLGRSPVPAALLDTPYGFQENADEITARALDYFREYAGNPMVLASFRRADADALQRATSVARAREAQYLFAGPGSPSYALAQWQGTEVPSIVADKLELGGIVVFASAAALTLGSHTVPVYEIYKVGEAPRWLDGLDLLSAIGLPVAVIPHYDNAEGGSHDTRFCYLGESRLAVLERLLPAGHFVLGIDSHTALVLDLVAGTASVLGVASVTVRADGRSEVFASGTTLPLAGLADAAARLRGASGNAGALTAAGAEADRQVPLKSAATRTPLDLEVRELEARFDEQLTTGRVPEAVRTTLVMDHLILDWSRDTDGTDDLDRARQAFQSLIVRLGERATQADAAGTTDRLAPLVELLIDLRGRARASRDFRQADWIRDALTDAGIELRDGSDGTTWGARQDA